MKDVNWTTSFFFPTEDYHTNGYFIIPVRKHATEEGYWSLGNIFISGSNRYISVLDEQIYLLGQVKLHVLKQTMNGYVSYEVCVWEKNMPRNFQLENIGGIDCVRISRARDFILTANENIKKYLGWCRNNHYDASRFLIMPSPRCMDALDWDFEELCCEGPVIEDTIVSMAKARNLKDTLSVKFTFTNEDTSCGLTQRLNIPEEFLASLSQ